MTRAVVFHRFQTHPERYLQQIRDNAEPLIIVRDDPDQNVVILTKDDYRAIHTALGLDSAV